MVKFSLPLAHGVFGPFDELLPIVLIAIFAGLLAFTWWSGRKTPLPPDEPDAAAEPISKPNAAPSLSDENAGVTDDAHYPVT